MWGSTSAWDHIVEAVPSRAGMHARFWFNGQKPFCGVDISDLLILVLLIETVGRSGKPLYRVFGPMSFAMYPVFEAQQAGGMRGS